MDNKKQIDSNLVKLRSLYREQKYDFVVQRLASPNPEGGLKHTHTDKRLFPRLLDALIFAALVGYEKGEKEPLKDATLSIANDQLTQITNNGIPASDFIFMLGVAETKDPNILKQPDGETAVKITEEYANAGLRIIDKWINSPDKVGIDPIDIVMEKAQEMGFWVDNES